METQAVIKVDKLIKAFKGFTLNIPELSIPKGFAVALIGENGAGKSTFMNILAGIRLDYKGNIEYFGGETNEEVIRENIGYTGPTHYFMPHWSVQDIANISEVLFDKFDKQRYFEICKILGIIGENPADLKKKVSSMSDGIKMRTTLATVFARETNMLILDEPASPLDPVMRDKLCQTFREYLAKGNGENTVFFSTHNIADMENVTDYAIVMSRGIVIEAGFVEDLKQKYILVKGNNEDFDKVKDALVDYQNNTYGFFGLALTDKLADVAGADIATETPNLNQISVGLMKHATNLYLEGFENGKTIY